jgi:uncharacterized membrane protein YfcA
VPLTSYLLVFVTATISGAINSVAGGGTLLTYPVLFSLIHLDARVANATNTMALWPASVAGAWSFRSHLKDLGDLAIPFSVVSVIGGTVGSVLVDYTSTKSFEAVIPWLIVLAAVLFVGHEPVMNRLGIKPLPHGGRPAYSPRAWRVLLFAQFLVSVYGGYFGAGIGIMMLASLSVMRFGDLFRINALKNLAAFLINVFAAAYFGCRGLVEWKIAGVMAVGAVFGALFGAGVAKKIGPRALRVVISLFGFAVASYYVYRNFTKQ